MIFANLANDFALVLALFGGCVGLLLYAAGYAAYKTAAHVKKDYRRQGGAKALATKAGGTLAKAGLKRLIFGRWR